MSRILKKNTISAPNSDKNDLDIVLLDARTKLPTPELGFSIKSQLGGASTLINASGATNFVYEILNKNMEIPKSKPLLINNSIRDSIAFLRKSEFIIVFRKVASNVFGSNLSLIDSQLSEHLAKIILSYYSKEATRFDDLLTLNFPLSNKQNNQPVYKIKEFMSNMASGMMPSQTWNGAIISLGRPIIS